MQPKPKAQKKQKVDWKFVDNPELKNQRREEYVPVNDFEELNRAALKDAPQGKKKRNKKA